MFARKGPIVNGMQIAFRRLLRGPIRQTASAILTFSALCVVAACGHPPQAAQVASAPPLQFLGQWGQSGTQPGQFQNPQAITCDAVGNVYIADDGKPARVEKFDATGHPLLVFGVSAGQNDSDIGVDPGNAIFIVDRRHGQVQIYSPEGEPFRTLFFRYRRDFHDPSSIAIDLDGNFYLADFLTGRVAYMNPAGRSLRTWTKPRGIDGRWMPFPIRLAADGNLYVADAAEQRVEKISPDGRYVASWNFAFTAIEPSLDAPKNNGLTVFRDLIAASDGAKRLLQIWNRDGELKLTVDFSQHPEWGEHAAPTDIAFAPSGDLFVLDRPDSRVLRFKVNIPQ